MSTSPPAVVACSSAADGADGRTARSLHFVNVEDFSRRWWRGGGRPGAGESSQGAPLKATGAGSRSKKQRRRRQQQRRRQQSSRRPLLLLLQRSDPTMTMTTLASPTRGVDQISGVIEVASSSGLRCHPSGVPARQSAPSDLSLLWVVRPLGRRSCKIGRGSAGRCLRRLGAIRDSG